MTCFIILYKYIIPIHYICKNYCISYLFLYPCTNPYPFTSNIAMEFLFNLWSFSDNSLVINLEGFWSVIGGAAIMVIFFEPD